MCADARGDCPVSCAIVLYHSFEKGALTEPGAKLVASRSNGSTALGTGVCFSHGFWGSEIRSLGLYSRCFYLGLNFFSSSPFLSPPPPSPPLPSHSLPSRSLRLLFGDSYGFFKLTITYVMINPSFKIKLKTCFL